MDQILTGLSPRSVFAYFEDISRIPRGSGNEKGVADYLCAFAEEKGLPYRTDALYNVLICKDASAGYENEPAVMLQGHTDMVCQKRPDVVHDFTKDPLTLRVKDGWLSADGTTLGADDGIAAAMMLAVLADDTIPHPALECLFTTQEETGLDGAAGFDYTGIRSKLLYNLDSEAEGVGTVSCAGGLHCDVRKPVTWSTADGETAEIRVSGLRGGHSGEDIAKHRANAHRVMGQLLFALSETCSFRIAGLSGGNMDNAIARECTACIVYAQTDAECVREALSALTEAQKEVFSEADREAGTITVTYGTDSVRAVSAEDTADIIGLLVLPPDGVSSYCEDLPELVEASCNLGILSLDGDGAIFGFLARSSVEERQKELRRKIFASARHCHAKIVSAEGYPGWAYDKHSIAAHNYCTVYERLTGKKPKIEAIHAGLECGLIKAAVPGIDPISIGPDMQDIHTPEERINIASVGRVYETVLALLALKTE